MSILHLVKCEACENTHPFESIMGPVYSQLPDSWLTLVAGNPQTKEGCNFCSKECLFDWMMEHWEISGGFKREEPQEQLDCKARRFLLVDGDTADITEGVKWQDGSVTLDGGEPSYASWNALKTTREGSGVQWIDQEVSK